MNKKRVDRKKREMELEKQIEKDRIYREIYWGENAKIFRIKS